MNFAPSPLLSRSDRAASAVQSSRTGRETAAASWPRLRIVPFKRMHLDILCPREADRHTLGLVGHDPDRAADMAALGPAYTLLYAWPGHDLDDAGLAGMSGAEGEAMTAVACGGVMLTPAAPDGTCVGDAWALTGSGVDRLPLAFHRAVRQGLAAIIARHRLRRVQAICLANHAQSRRWLSKLGFARETLEPGMAGVVPGERVHIYALIPQKTQEETA